MKKNTPWVLAAVVGVLVAASLVTFLLTARDTAEFPDGSPEAAVQEYLDAVLDRDGEAAVRSLTADSPCDVEDFDKAYLDNDVHVALNRVDVSGSTARVDVVITSGSGSLLPSGWSEERTFRLERSGERWLVTGTPWPLFDCGMSVK